MFPSLNALKAANIAAGHHFFDRDKLDGETLALLNGRWVLVTHHDRGDDSEQKRTLYRAEQDGTLRFVAWVPLWRDPYAFMDGYDAAEKRRS